jgi:hypothetical protein
MLALSFAHAAAAAQGESPAKAARNYEPPVA